MGDSPHAIPSQLLRDPLHLLSLGLGAGCVPKAPGTWGTVVGVAVYGALPALSLPKYLAVLALAFAAGVWLCGRTAARMGGYDHPAIVWDEIVGYLITMTALPGDWRWAVAGFLLFRLLDIAKPGPIGWSDRRVKGGLGIMLDDAVAGLIGCAILHVVSRLAIL
jgi:phosphatidylglycerophosphatase A